MSRATFRDTPKIVIEDESAPSAAFAANVRMEDLFEKLKLLNYDIEFVQDLKMKYISRHYFMIPTNPGEQFYMFTAMAAWLVRKAGKKFDPPQESDDPNSTISLILDFLKEIDVPVDFPPNKLKQGVGEHAVYVLDNLADYAIKTLKFKWEKVQIPPDETVIEPEIEEDDAEIILEKVEEEMLAEYDDDDDDIIHVDDITKLYKESKSNSHKPEKILESTVDAEEWKLELERVLPQLKLNVNADSRDWRAHLEQMKMFHAAMSQNLSGTTNQLDKLCVDVGRALDKINTREIHLNRQLEPQLQELRGLQEELSKVKEQYRDVSGGVTERTRTLNKLDDDLNKLKKETDERGSSMTDGKARESSTEQKVSTSSHRESSADVHLETDYTRAVEPKPSQPHRLRRPLRSTTPRIKPPEVDINVPQIDPHEEITIADASPTASASPTKEGDDDDDDDGEPKISKEELKMRRKVGFLIIAGLLCIAFGATAGYLWPSLFQDILKKELVLTPNSTSFKMWRQTPIPMYLKIYLYNWVNSDEVLKNPKVKPHFVETGPYVFREIDTKVNRVWNENGTVTFQQNRVWHFNASMSNGDLSDKVTQLNPVAATIAYMMRNAGYTKKKLTNLALKRLEKKIVVTKTVKELLFDGYDDILLKLVSDFVDLPYDKFAYFYKRNNSDSYDGTFNMLTGEHNLLDLGIIKEWKFHSTSPYYSQSCGKIKGTNGDLWPPLTNNDTVSVFSPDVCSTLSLNSDGPSEWLGVAGRKYVSRADMLDNGTKVKSRKCFCEGVECQPSGAQNVSLCKFGAPAFISLPHFYLADESYRQNITGLNPNKEKHEFFLVVEPDSGIPLQVRAALQINFLVNPDPELTFFKNLPLMYAPMIWFIQEANLTSEFGNQVKLLTVLPPVGNGVSFSIVGVGVILLALSAFFYFRYRLKNEQNENLVPKETRDIGAEVNISNEE